MVITAEPSWTFFHPIRSARHSESCWVPPCGETDITRQGGLKTHRWAELKLKGHFTQFTKEQAPGGVEPAMQIIQLYFLRF